MTDRRDHVVFVGLREDHIDRIDFDTINATLILDERRAAKLAAQSRAKFAAVATFGIPDTMDYTRYESQIPFMIDTVQQWADELGAPTAVVGVHEFTTLPAAHVRARFGTPGVDVATAQLCRDKVLSKAALAAKGVRVPRFLAVDRTTSMEDLRLFGGSLHGKVVLKPRRQAGSFGVTIFDDAAALLRYVQEHGLEDDYEVEEFIDGAVCHFDGVIRDGVTRFFSASRYVWDAVGYRFDGAAVATATFDDPTETRHAAEFIDTVLLALGLHDSAFHIEGFHTPSGEFVFLEAACRYGGAHVNPHVKKVYGVDLAWESVLACLRAPTALQTPTTIADYPGVPASGWLIAPFPTTSPCLVTAVHGVDDLPASVVDASVPQQGEVINKRPSSYGGSGKFIFVGPNTASIRADMQAIMASYRVDVVPH